MKEKKLRFTLYNEVKDVNANIVMAGSWYWELQGLKQLETTDYLRWGGMEEKGKGNDSVSFYHR